MQPPQDIPVSEMFTSSGRLHCQYDEEDKKEILRRAHGIIKEGAELLMIDSPRTACLLIERMEVIPSLDLMMSQGATTDGRSIRYNPLFVNKLTPIEAEFLLGHEVKHPELSHHTRRGHRIEWLWNAACDYIVNHLNVLEGIGEMPEGALFNPSLYSATKMTAEMVYEDLLKRLDCHGDTEEVAGSDLSNEDLESKLKSGLDKVKGDVEDYSPHREEEGPQQEEVKRATTEEMRAEDLSINEAMERANIATAKLKGSGSVDHFKLIKAAKRGIQDWKSMLEEYITRHCRDRPNWNRQNRKLAEQGIWAPLKRSKTIGNMAFMLDESGSVSDSQFERLIETVNDILSNFDRRESIYLIHFDHEIKMVEEFEEDKEITYCRYGNGGTRFREAFNEVSRLRKETDIDLGIMCTDMYDAYPAEPDWPMFWLSVSPHLPYGDVPYGQVAFTMEYTNGTQ